MSSSPSPRSSRGVALTPHPFGFEFIQLKSSFPLLTSLRVSRAFSTIGLACGMIVFLLGAEILRVKILKHRTCHGIDSVMDRGYQPFGWYFSSDFDANLNPVSARKVSRAAMRLA